MISDVRSATDRIGEGRKLRFRIIGITRNHARQPLGQRFGDLGCMRRHPHARRVDARPAGVFRNRSDHHVQVFLPIVNRVLADDDLAIAGAMHFDTGIALPKLRGAGVAEHHAALALAQNLAAAGVIGGIVAEGLRRRAGLDQRLDDAIGRPRLGAAGLQHQRHFQRKRGNPERMHARRIAGQHHAQRIAAREVAQFLAAGVAETAIEHGQIQIPREPVEHRAHLRHHLVDLLHVAARQHMRQAGGGGNLRDVIVRRLHRIAEGQFTVQEELRPVGANLHKLFA